MLGARQGNHETEPIRDTCSARDAPRRNGFAGTDHLYIRDTEAGRVWTPTPLPVHRLPEHYQVRFTEDRARFSLHLDTDLTVVVQHQV